MLKDRYDLPLTISSETARDAFVEAVDRALALQVDVLQNLQKAVDAEPHFAMAHAVMAFQLHGAGDLKGADAAIKKAKEPKSSLSSREASFVAAMERLIAAGGSRGGTTDALPALLEHIESFPRDAFMLQQTSMVINTGGMRDRRERMREILSRLAPTYGDDWVYQGMLAMNLQESDRFEEARRAAELSLRGNPAHAQAIHPLAHVYYETNDHAEGSAVLEKWLQSYEWRSPYHCHLSWHEALFALNLGRYSRVIEILEKDIVPVERSGTLISDIASLLWRLQLYDVVDSPLDWRSAERPATAAVEVPTAGFQAVHVAFVSAATGDDTLFNKLVDGLRIEEQKGHPTAGTIVLPLALGIRAFSHGDYDETIRCIEPLVEGLAALGGSNAQREVFTDTLLQAYLRAGRHEEAKSLLERRLKRRTFARDLSWLGQAQSALGEDSQAKASFARARELWSGAEDCPELRRLLAVHKVPDSSLD